MGQELCSVSEIVVKDFLDAGIHYGHRTSRWNPRMRPYIYGRRSLIHIIDIKETIRGLLRAKRYLQKVASQGSLVLFVGTKKQAADAIRERPWQWACRTSIIAGWGGCSRISAPFAAG